MHLRVWYCSWSKKGPLFSLQLNTLLATIYCWVAFSWFYSVHSCLVFYSVLAVCNSIIKPSAVYLILEQLCSCAERRSCHTSFPTLPSYHDLTFPPFWHCVSRTFRANLAPIPKVYVIFIIILLSVAFFPLGSVLDPFFSHLIDLDCLLTWFFSPHLCWWYSA